ncbi:hypothetical protein CB0940_10940 [Cercospora beticola]|uniref:Secreted protein n=1 Tax=Cercospora beticola TaxID=122368 RepID=A0A2G5HDX5_CERBT|nr:hypothetical protein CB0940_10940 [Cercospora beticola]PIA90728.1 hypothetical protein CB0940_10940 [Cercospora beticola]WPB07715.1 hypothetical protein RHO25_012377 [Cercospora beticola]
MRFLFASAILLGTATAGLRPDEMACSIKNSYVVDAINKLCSKYDMVAPSDYSSSGVKSDPPYAWVAINGKCDPPQWVPADICKAQFYMMCNTGDNVGNNAWSFGKNDCQRWDIVASKSQKEKAPPLKSGTSRWEFDGTSILSVFGIGKREIEAYQRNVDEVMDAARRDRK